MNKETDEITEFRIRELKETLKSQKTKVETYRQELQHFFENMEKSLSWKPTDEASFALWLGQAGTFSQNRLHLTEKYEIAQKDYIATLEEYIEVLEGLIPKPFFEWK